METKEIKIEVPQGYEIDRQKSTFEKIVFKKVNPLSDLPECWEEYCEQTKNRTYYTYSPYNESHVNETAAHGFYGEFSTKERAEQFIALGQLMQLRDYWVRGYKEFKYALLVTRNKNILVYAWSWYHTYPHILTFPTKEMAEEFKECFPDLIKRAFLLE